MERILIVEDDVIIGGGVKQYLERKGFEAFVAENTVQAKEMLKLPFNLVLLDVNLPDGNGFELCKEIKSSVPIIFLTANDTEDDMIKGFEYGCDDYIAKPFSPKILYHRIIAVLKRSHNEHSKDIFCYKNMSVNFAKMQVMVSDIPVKLSTTEYKLLELLIKNKGQVMTRNLIFEKIWDCNENYIDENTLNVHIRRLRQKIEDDPKNPQFIVTVFGIGYTFGE